MLAADADEAIFAVWRKRQPVRAARNRDGCDLRIIASLQLVNMNGVMLYGARPDLGLIWADTEAVTAA
jgi:hypothetical protein